MQREICGRIYNTDTATLIARRQFGAFGESTGYEEILYQTPEGSYFLYGRGGEDSPYPEERITRMGAKKAEEWQKEAGK